MRIAILGGTGSYGHALAVRLVALGEDTVVIGSRDAERALATAAELGGGVEGATNEEAVRGADLAVLAVKAEAALDTARVVAEALGDTPLFSVASSMSFAKDGVRPAPDGLSLAERIQELVTGPVVAGLHSIAAANLDDAPPEEDALICGDDTRAMGLALELARKIVAGKALDAGPLAGARTLEGLTAVIVNLNRRYKAHAGIRVTGLSGRVISIVPVEGLPEIRESDDLGAMIAAGIELRESDVVVIAQKAVSKAEGRIVRFDDVEPSQRARALAGPGTDLRQLEVILRETVRVVRSRAGLVIAETRHGFVCASAGVDHSNTAEPGTLILLPLDSDASARRIRSTLRQRTGLDLAVIVTDSFGRPFRKGTTDVAIGVAGLAPLRDLRGTPDRGGALLRSTQVAVADEIAGAANLVRLSKADGVPVVIVRGIHTAGDGSAAELVMPAERDLFR